MAELTANERQMISDAVAKALTEDNESVLAAASAPAAEAIVDPKVLFCEYWDKVKAVLQFLMEHLPAWMRPIVAAIIRIGDILHGTLCK